MPSITLKRLSSDSKMKMIDTTSGVFVLDSTANNNFKIKDRANNQWLGGIYNSNDFTIENAIHNPAVNSQYTNDIDLHGPSGKFISMFQSENFAVGLKPETTTGITHYSYAVSGYQVEPNLVAVYKTPVVNSQTYYNSLSSPAILLSGLPFAHISEIVLDQVEPNLSAGIIYANSFDLKNMYNEGWNVDAKPNTTALNNYYELVQEFTLPTESSTNRALQSIAMSGEWLFVGDGTYNEKRGKVNIYKWDGIQFNLYQSLFDNTLSAGACFGGNNGPTAGSVCTIRKIAVYENILLISAYGDNINRGKLYYYKFDGNTWNFQQALCSVISHDRAYFGNEIALYKTTAIIGAPGTTVTAEAGKVSGGVAFIYDLVGSNFVHSQTLSCGFYLPYFGSVPGMGSCVDISGNRCLVGSPYTKSLSSNTIGDPKNGVGIIFSYKYNGSVWSLSQVISSPPSMTASRYFGTSVRLLDSNMAVVGNKLNTAQYVDSFVFNGDLLTHADTLTGLPYINATGSSNWIDAGLSIDNDYIAGLQAVTISGITDSYQGPFLYTHNTDNTYTFSEFLSSYITTTTPYPRWGNRVAYNRDNLLAVGGDNSANIQIYKIYPLQSYKLSNTRYYSKIGQDQGDVWVSYKTGKNFTSDKALVANSENYIGKISTSAISTSAINSYEHIERIKGVNRAGNEKLHKSNVFSVELVDSHLNESITDVTVRQRIQKSLEGIFREVIKKVAPAYTQFWKTIWKGM